MLSEEQWSWLDDELFPKKNDNSSFPELTVIVSSVQVLTTNPSVESWGHFPLERKRLLSKLRKFEIETGKSLLILSVSQISYNSFIKL